MSSSRLPFLPAPQVRGDHAEVVQLLVQSGGKVRATSGALVDLQTTPLSRCADVHS